MSNATRCPVCLGSGRLPIQTLAGTPAWTTSGPETKECHGCLGKGWAVIP